MNSNRAILAAALSLVFTAFNVTGVADAAAKSGDPVRMRVVSYEGLDLDRPGHAALLFARIKQAATVVCNPFRDISLARNQQRRECTETAIADAVARVNHPNLTAHYAAKARRLARVTANSDD